MTTYAEQYLKRKVLTETNIQDIGWNVFTPLSNIKSELRDDFEDWNSYSDIADETMVCIYYTDIDYYCIDTTKYEYDTTGRDELVFEDYIDQLIADHDYYLVCAYDCTWDKQTGYTIVDEKHKIFQRDYEVTQYVVGSDINGKVLLLRETSHDCPMGYRTMAIGLTEKDYDELEDSDWGTVVDFVNGISELVIEF